MASIRPRNTYTEEKLRPAVAAARTLGEVLTHLGLEDTKSRRRYASERIRALGIDNEHLRNSSMLYTDEQLAAAVAASTTMVGVALKLGAKPVGGTIHYLKRRIMLLGLDMDHFAYRQASAPPSPASEGFRRECGKLTVNDDLLRAAVPSARSIADVVRILGLEVTGPRHRAVREGIERLDLDTRHFLSQASNRGVPGRKRLRPHHVLIFRPEQTYRRSAGMIRRRMLELGIPEKCSMCDTGPEWRGLPMSLEVDHINGDFRDNRPENLRLLCPNCHATTNNYCRRKQVHAT